MSPGQTPRIFVFSTSYLPLIGGAEVAIHEIAKRIPEFRFFVFTARLQRSLPQEEVKDGVHIIRLGFGGMFDKWLLPFLSCWRAHQMLREDGAVLLWGMMISQSTIGAYFLKLWRPETPLVITLQEGDSDTHLKSGRRGLIAFFWKRILGVADMVTVISEHLKKQAYDFGYAKEKKIAIIPNGVREEFLNSERMRHELPGISHDDYVVLSVSRLVEKNGLFDLLSGFAEFASKEPTAKLLLVGDGPLRNDLKRRVQVLELNDRVIMTGTIPHDDILRYYQSSDVFVRPALSEGLGSVFLESMAAGVPVVATGVGGIREIIKDRKNGIIVRERDSRDIARALGELRTNPALASELAKEGRFFVRAGYTWRGVANSMKEIFSQYTS